MPGSTGRVFAGLSALAALWICIYWWWTPSDKPVTGLDEPAPAEPDPHPAPALQSPARIEVPPAPALIAPRFRDYTVRADDTFQSIARRELGSASHASAIAAANPFTDPSRLKAGQVIRIPLDPSNIQGKVADNTPATPAPAPEAPAVAAPETPADIEYTIRAGDALSKIARKYYGSAEYADFLFEYNRDRLGLTDKDSIRQGQVLLIPAKPAR